MTAHIKPLGGLMLVYGAFNLLTLGLVLILLGGMSGLMGGIGVTSGDGELIAVGLFYGVVLFIIAIFGLVPPLGCAVSGAGLLMERSWARLPAMIFGALATMNMPLGTLLGVYALVVCLDKDVTAHLNGGAMEELG